MIPETLKLMPRWVNWIKRPKENGGYAKIPLQTNLQPDRWMSYEEALSNTSEEPFCGLGIQLGAPLAGWDLDWKTQEDTIPFETIPEYAQKIIDFQHSYTEWSPSGRGVHILVSGDVKNDPEFAPGVEIYGHDRFLTVTGKTIHDWPVARFIMPAAEDRDSELMKSGRNNDLQKEAGRIMARGEVKSEEELVERLKLHAKFRHAGETDEKKLLDLARRAWAKYGEDAPKLLVTSIEAIMDEKLSWLWENKIPLCHLTMFVGQPGAGKSSMAQHLAADLSRSGVKTLLLNAEEHVPTSIKPRLRAMGADLEKISIVQLEVAGKPQELRLDTQVEKLAEAIDPTVKLIIIDPITSYLGDAKMNTETEVRSVLAGLAELAAKYKLAIVTITHFNKKDSTDAKDRVMGARAFTGYPRVVWTFQKDPDNPDQRLMVPGKAEHLEGLRYEIVEATDEPSGNKIGIVRLGGAVKETGDAVLESHLEKPSERLKKDILAFVLEQLELAGAPVEVRRLKEQAAEAFKVSISTVERAVKGKVEVTTTGSAKGKKYFWGLAAT